MPARAGGTSRRAEKPPGCTKPNTGACQKHGGQHQWLKSRGIATAAEGCTPLAPPAWGGCLGHTLLYPCRVSHPTVGDTSAPLGDKLAAPVCVPQAGGSPPLPPAPPAARRQDQVAAEAALCRPARQGLPQKGWAAHPKVTAGDKGGDLAAQGWEPAKGSHAAIKLLKGFGGSRQDKPTKPAWSPSAGTGPRPTSLFLTEAPALCPCALQDQRATPALWGTELRNQQKEIWGKPCRRGGCSTNSWAPSPGFSHDFVVCSLHPSQAPTLDRRLQAVLKVQRPEKN